MARRPIACQKRSRFFQGNRSARIALDASKDRQTGLHLNWKDGFPGTRRAWPTAALAHGQWAVKCSEDGTDQTVALKCDCGHDQLLDDVTADRRFKLVPSSSAPNCPTEGPALRDRLRAASQTGAQIVIIGYVHKMSTLVQLAQTAAIDTSSQRVVFRKFFSFRGDNDEAWQRAERFVSEEIRDQLLESRSQQ